MKVNYPIENPHTFTAADIVAELQTDSKLGITAVTASERIEEFGPNRYEPQKEKSLFMVALLQFKSPIVYLLFFAVAVTLYLGDYIEAIAISVVIIVNALIGFFMELQARTSMKALKDMDVSFSRVIRDGKIQEIPSEEIVPGDILMLEAGDIVPGDARLLKANQLQCEESSLTGESFPSEKNTKTLEKDVPLGDRANMVFKGTAVTNGNGKAVIIGTAAHTQLGNITSLVENAEDQETPLDKKLATLTKKLIWITLGMIAIFAATGFIQGKSWVLILETSIALAVAAFPEGLPIVATVALAYGMLLMAKRNAIVKTLSAVETLGSTNVILTDKTGTLTENKIYVDTLSFLAQKVKVTLKDGTLAFVGEKMVNNQEELQKLILIGTLCNNATLKKGEKASWMGDPIEVALFQLTVASGGSVKEIKKEFERIGEIPFSSEAKMMATLHESANGNFVAAKGSVEHLLEKCTQVQVGAKTKKLEAADKKVILAESEKMAADGLRVIAFAYKAEKEIKNEDYLNELVYVGIIGFLDPPRMDIKDAMVTCRNAGIKIVMITGDHPLTALNIAKQVKLVDEDEQNAITGIDIPDMDSLTEDWRAKILNNAVFARTTPQQKLEIVSIYQNAGNIVAMTGDGVNDAPALKKADIGIAMGIRGTQVAKETANIVLKDDSFVSIASAVAHGREIFQNIQKFVVYLVSCNLSEIFVVTLLGFVAPAATLLPLQILFLNMVTDVFPALALGLGKGDETVMQRPPRDSNLPIVSNKGWVTISVYALVMTIATVGAILYCKAFISTDPKVLNNVAFITLAFAQLFHVFNMASPNANLLINDVTKNKFVWFALFICTVLVVLVYEIPQMRLVLGLEVLAVKIWMITIVAALMPLVLVQFYKGLRGVSSKTKLN